MASVGYTIDLQVNGVSLARHALIRRHAIDQDDTTVLTGRARIILKKDDVVSVQLVPQQSEKFYTIKQFGTSLKISRERLW